MGDPGDRYVNERFYVLIEKPLRTGFYTYLLPEDDLNELHKWIRQRRHTPPPHRDLAETGQPQNTETAPAATREEQLRRTFQKLQQAPVDDPHPFEFPDHL